MTKQSLIKQMTLRVFDVAETRHSDRLDFTEINVVFYMSQLDEAYEAGVKHASSRMLKAMADATPVPKTTVTQDGAFAVDVYPVEQHNNVPVRRTVIRYRDDPSLEGEAIYIPVDKAQNMEYLFELFKFNRLDIFRIVVDTLKG